MKKIRISMIIFLALAIIVSIAILPACKAATSETTAAETTAAATTAAETTAAETTAAAKTYKIVNLWLGMAAPYCPPYKAEFEKGAKENGWELIFFD
ncbi:MAG: hypothetical protein M1365_00720, partial [Actinobacteria bacterium]|nr:hypothetical protein [Actinomycetota bacterium]